MFIFNLFIMSNNNNIDNNFHMFTIISAEGGVTALQEKSGSAGKANLVIHIRTYLIFVIFYHKLYTQ